MNKPIFPRRPGSGLRVVSEQETPKTLPRKKVGSVMIALGRMDLWVWFKGAETKIVKMESVKDPA